ncbi:MAG: 4-carboxymuconolactone decarboxylase [Alphaproteobacteria bacterium]
MTTPLEGSRLERMEREDCPAEYLDAWDEILRTRGFDVMPHVFALLANSPGAMSVVTPVGAHVRYNTDFDDVLRELVIMTVAQEMRCEYEWKHHWRVAERAGATPERLAKIGTPELEAEPSPVGPAVRYARMLTQNEPIDDALVDTLKADFGIAGFVDLTIMIGYYGMLARFINTIRIPVEDSYSDISFNKVA